MAKEIWREYENGRIYTTYGVTRRPATEYAIHMNIVHGTKHGSREYMPCPEGWKTEYCDWIARVTINGMLCWGSPCLTPEEAIQSLLNALQSDADMKTFYLLDEIIN